MVITEYRLEKDLLGERQIPVEAYWGIHTARARIMRTGTG